MMKEHNQLSKRINNPKKKKKKKRLENKIEKKIT
jgi:hypothetical protein